MAAAATDVAEAATAVLTAVLMAATATLHHVEEEDTDIPATDTNVAAPATAILHAVAAEAMEDPNPDMAPLTEGSPMAENRMHVNHSGVSPTDTVASRVATTAMAAGITEDTSHVRETGTSATAAATAATTGTREEAAQTESAETAKAANLATPAAKTSLLGDGFPARHPLGAKDCAHGRPPAKIVEVAVD